MMTLLDEYTRQCLAIQVERQITAAKVLAVLEKAMAQYGGPDYIRRDNGPEFIAKKVQQGPKDHHIKAIYIKSFHSRFRDECLSRESLLNLREARVVIEDWRPHYNTE
jgi:putative transposase